MTDAATHEPGRAQNPYPARSKMLDMYAGDIAGMLAEGHPLIAEHAALAIPHIAVALADSALQSSGNAYRDWCCRWVQPEFAPAVYDGWCSRSNECEQGSGVPFAALRTLRLQRRARELPARTVRQDSPSKPDASQAVTCALLGAAFRWYEQEGRYQRVVQTNLARLGVLR
jgi:hypothetical protein